MGDRRPNLLGVLLRAVVPLGIVAAGCIAYAILAVETDEAKSPPPEEQVIRTRVTELAARDYPVVVTTHGIVQPHNEVTLSAQVAGLIIHVSPSFEVGSYFNRGEVLVELDARDYETAVAVAEAQRLAADSALRLTDQTYQRTMSLFEKNAISEAEVNQASAARAQAAAQLDSTVARLEQARRDLERTKIVAPFDGRVRGKAVGLGQLVGTGTQLGEVFAVDFAEVRLPISSRERQFLQLPEMADDPPVEVELRDAITQAASTVWRGKIVRTEGALDENSLELFAIARVDDPFGLESGRPPLRIGQPVEASIAGTLLSDVVAIPRTAVRELDQIILVDATEFTLRTETIDPIWSDEEHIIVRDATLPERGLLSTTHLVYAPAGGKVEIIQDQPPSTATAKTTN